MANVNPGVVRRVRERALVALEDVYGPLHRVRRKLAWYESADGLTRVVIAVSLDCHWFTIEEAAVQWLSISGSVDGVTAIVAFGSVRARDNFWMEIDDVREVVADLTPCGVQRQYHLNVRHECGRPMLCASSGFGSTVAV